MIALRAISISVAYIVGIVLATLSRSVVPTPLLIIAAVAGATITVCLYVQERQWREWSQLVIVLAAVLCAFPIGYWRTMHKVGPPRPGSLRHVLGSLEGGTRLQMRGTVCAEPQLRGKRQGNVKVRVDSVRTGSDAHWTDVAPGRIMLNVYTVGQSGPRQLLSFDRLMHFDAYGYRIEVDTTFRPPRRVSNPGEFDLAGYLLQNDLQARLRCYAGRIQIREESTGHVLGEIALRVKRNFIATYKRTIRGPASRLVTAATLGARNALAKEEYRGLDITESFRHAGVGHVLAVSGLHVSIVALLLYSLFRVTGLRPRVFAPMLISFLILFAILTGARPSSVRAVVMNSVILIAVAYFRYDLRQATRIGLSLASLLILLVNPVILFSPSFLLSFGAVLSLLLIAPPVNRCLCLLRGFSLLFTAGWLALIVGLCFVGTRVFLDARNCTGLAGLLWLGILVGGVLNNRFPQFWTWGMERVPLTLRLLVSAQLAIQIGMIIPLSAWFFGRLPVAGALVNLLAIPAIGILVQLGMLTGLLGMIPVVGQYLALPFGAADTVTGTLFFELAHAGTTYFPFPATPRPTLHWLVAYYIVVGCAVCAEPWRLRVQGLLYRWWPRYRHFTLARFVPYVPAVLCVLLPLLNIVPAPDRCEQLTCFAAGRYPLVTLVSRRKKAVVINGGDVLRGSRALFDGLRRQGAVEVDSALLCSPNPSAGASSLVALLKKMRIRKCLLPAVADTGKEYLDALGDDYLAWKAGQGEPWAVAYGDAYYELVSALRSNGASVEALRPGTVLAWENASVRLLRGPSRKPDRFVTSALTPFLEVSLGGYRWLILTDSHHDVLREVIPRKSGPYDVLVLPDFTKRKTFPRLIDTVVELAQPRVVIMSGSYLPSEFDVEAWARGKRCLVLLMTARDGAVTATLDRDGNLEMRGHASTRTITLRPAR